MTFVLRVTDGVEFLAAQGLGAPHGFSTRLGGVSEGVFASLNIGLRRGDREEALRENYRRLMGAIGAEGLGPVLSNQVHGTVIRQVTEADVKRDLLDPADYEADGLTTDRRGVVLTIFTADCIPILLCDPQTPAIAALHAGWRGTAADIAGKGVAALRERYGCRPENIRAAIGPGIGPCCFETGPEVPAAMAEALGPGAWDHVKAGKAEGKYLVDLKGLNRAFLLRAGVGADHIAVSEDCTFCRPDRYWSHRYTQGVRGSQGAMIYLP